MSYTIKELSTRFNWLSFLFFVIFIIFFISNITRQSDINKIQKDIISLQEIQNSDMNTISTRFDRLPTVDRISNQVISDIKEDYDYRRWLSKLINKERIIQYDQQYCDHTTGAYEIIGSDKLDTHPYPMYAYTVTDYYNDYYYLTTNEYIFGETTCLDSNLIEASELKQYIEDK